MNNYWKYLVKKEKPLLTIYTAICFILFLFPIIFTTATYRDSFSLIDYAHSQVGNNLQRLEMLLIPLMMVLPIFNYRFVLSKKTVDVYFTLPIKRSQLFNSHYIVTLIMAILPPLIMIILSYGILMVTSHQGIYVIAYWMKWTVFVISICIALYALITFILMKTNNVIDASIMSISYVLVPLIAWTAIESFMRSQTFIPDLPIFDVVESLMYLFSPIHLINKTVGNFVYNSPIMIEHWLYFMYMLGISGLFTFLAKKEFENKKGEDAEQISTHWLTYPLIVNVISVCLISFVSFRSDITLSIVFLTIIFIIYLIINFIASKSIRFTPKLLIKFLVLIVCFNGFSLISRKTEFFGMNRQLVNVDKVRTIEVVSNVYNEKTGEWNDYYLYINDLDEQKELVDQIQNYQIEASKKYKNDPDSFNTDATIDVKYQLNDNTEIVRFYYCFTPLEIKSIIDESQNLKDENFKW